MGRLLLSGDTHGQYDIKKFTKKEFPIQEELTRDDVVWILGDFGVCWDGDGQDRWIQNWWGDKNFTVISTIGNHENWVTILDDLPVVEKFGGRLYQVKENVFYAQNGVFEIAGKKILNVNGADSHDVFVDGKPYRKPYFDWWPEEQISETDIEDCIWQLLRHEGTVDYIFSHTGGSEVSRNFGFLPSFSDKQLDVILNAANYQTHFCGHMHADKWVNSRTRVVYNDILEVGTI